MSSAPQPRAHLAAGRPAGLGQGHGSPAAGGALPTGEVQHSAAFWDHFFRGETNIGSKEHVGKNNI